jgi:hypothetical protein
MDDIADVEDLVKAILFEAIGQTFAVIGMAVAKWSLGLFLLRLVSLTWHKVAIWITMGSLMAASISVCFVFWLQCTPPAYLYDRRIPGGYCHINTTPVSFTLCSTCSASCPPRVKIQPAKTNLQSSASSPTSSLRYSRGSSSGACK